MRINHTAPYNSSRFSQPLALLLVGLFLLLSPCAWGWTQADWTNYTIATSFAGGSGTKSAPFLISTPAQLAYLSQQVSSGVDYAGKYFKQTNNFNMLGSYASGGTGLFKPIGTKSHPFKGHYDGGGYRIYDLKLDLIKDGNYYDVALFGYVSSGSIKGLTIEQVALSNNSTGIRYGACLVAHGENVKILKDTIRGDAQWKSSYRGGLIAYVTGTSTIDSCANESVVYATYYSYNISTYHSYAGGLVGYNAGTLKITTSSNTGNVLANTDFGDYDHNPRANAGGLVGYNTGSLTISISSNTGDVTATAKREYWGRPQAFAWAGGILGLSENGTASISYCYNTGNITASAKIDSDEDKPYAAGIGTNCTVSNSYNAGKLTGVTQKGITTTTLANNNHCYYTNSGTDLGSGTYCDSTQLSSDGDILASLSNIIFVQLKTSTINKGYPTFYKPEGTTYTVRVSVTRGFAGLGENGSTEDYYENQQACWLVEGESFDCLSYINELSVDSGTIIVVKAQKNTDEEFFEYSNCTIFEGWKKNGKSVTCDTRALTEEDDEDYYIEDEYCYFFEDVVTSNVVYEASFSDGTFRVSVQAYPEDAGTVCITGQ